MAARVWEEAVDVKYSSEKQLVTETCCSKSPVWEVCHLKIGLLQCRLKPVIASFLIWMTCRRCLLDSSEKLGLFWTKTRLPCIMCEVEQEDGKVAVYTHKTFERDWTLKLEEIEAFEPLNVKQLALMLLDSLNLDVKVMPGCALPFVSPSLLPCLLCIPVPILLCHLQHSANVLVGADWRGGFESEMLLFAELCICCSLSRCCSRQALLNLRCDFSEVLSDKEPYLLKQAGM